MFEIRHDWSIEELEKLHALPLLELVARASVIHTKFHPVNQMQICSLISIKTGGCPEDCKYCPQSSSNQTFVKPQPMMAYEDVMTEAKKAIGRGATRICLGAAWREVRDNIQFENILKMVSGITSLGAEVCCTLGMLKSIHAKRLKDAGLYAYNHNLDSSESFYKTVVTTRTYQERLETHDVVQEAGLSLCCGGIIGMGESDRDRLEMIQTLSKRTPHPDSVPINRLTRVPGTPYENLPEATVWEIARIIAVTRIVLPKAIVRFSCGRGGISMEGQALCFLAGANSLWLGEKLLTVANHSIDKDEEMFMLLGLEKRPPLNLERCDGCT